jgi:polyhydroxyalkanoate synthesis repressor PhaR
MKKIITIRKYPNRRLYDIAKNTYVTLEDIATTLAEGHDIRVLDTKTDKDITKVILRNILIKKEKKPGRTALMNEKFLKSLISLYDSPIEGFVPIYLEQALDNFLTQQKELINTMNDAFGDVIPPKASLDVIREKEPELQQTLKGFEPFKDVFKDK